MKTPTLLALTSHGNAPYLMVTRLARAIGNIRVVIPDYYGIPQRKILIEELPECQHQVFLSRDLGRLLAPLLLDGSRSSHSFGEFGARLADPSNPKGVLAIENGLGILLKNGFTAERLDGLEQTRFSLEDFSGVLNTTLPVRVNLPVHVFFFTAWMSALYGSLPPGEDSQAASRTLEMLMPYAELWKMAEATYTHSFIPRIHAFSYLGIPISGVTHTPPLAFIRPVTQNLSSRSLLFIPSGTRTDVHQLNQLATNTPADYQRLVLGHLRDHGDFSPKTFIRVNASTFGDVLLEGVVARGGWGTIWECIANEKPLAVTRLSFVDDPEMGHTQAAITHTGLGMVLDDGIDRFIQTENLLAIKQNINRIRLEDQRIFGKRADDGIGFIADSLRSSMPEWLAD